MKANLSIVLALCALVLSLTAMLRPAPPPAEKKAKPIVFPTKVEPGALTNCDDPRALGSLEDLMTKKVNAAMTRISFSLHHDTRPAEARLASVAEHANLMLGCIDKMPTFRPDVGIDHLSEYYRYLNTMQANTLALAVAAMENDLPRAQHWFTHLKQDCVACHTKFRPASEETK